MAKAAHDVVVLSFRPTRLSAEREQSGEQGGEKRGKMALGPYTRGNDDSCSKKWYASPLTSLRPAG